MKIFLIGLNIWKSLGARSRLFGVKRAKIAPYLLTHLLTSPLRSHWNIGPQQLYNCWGFYSGSIFYRDRVASPVLQPPTSGSTRFSRFLRHAWATVGLFFSPVTARGKIAHTISQKHVNIILPTDDWLLDFLATDDFVRFQATLWALLSGS
jgi:hypothetical protein